MLRTSIGSSKEKPKLTPGDKRNIKPADTGKNEASSPAESSPSKRQKIESSDPMENKNNPAIVSIAGKSTAEDNFKQDILELLESDFTCCICEEIMVKATMTRCKHFFCGYCLEECKKQKKTCPICRSPRMLERGIEFIDNHLDKMTKLVSEDLYGRRMELIKEREGVSTRKVTRHTIG